MPGCSAFSAKVVISSLNSMISIFSPRSSRMIDCTRVRFHAHAGTHRIHILVAALHSDLGALAGFTGNGANDHGVVVNFGNL